MRIAVTGLGIISGQGTGVDKTLQSLLSPALQLRRVSLFDTVIEAPVCEAPLTNEELADIVAQGGADRKYYTRTAMLGILAAGEALMNCFEVDSFDRLRQAVKNSALRTGLVSATSVAGMDSTERFYRQYMQDSANGDINDLRGHDCGYSTNAIAEYCGITDFKTTVSTACSSSANAIIFGAGLIKAGFLDVVVAGGTDALCFSTLNGFNSLKILDGEPCRPFDKDRAGLNLGEGAGYIVLQREDTLQHKNGAGRIPYAYLSGYGNATDAFHQTATSENGEGACLAMREALQQAGLQAGDIDYINAHGTGTPNNDSSEGAALLRIFSGRAGESAIQLPPFSSTKPFTGHTLAASGGIESVFCVLALQHGLLYPNLNFKAPFNTELMPQTTLETGKSLKNIISNSFGFGGNNSSIIFSKAY